MGVLEIAASVNPIWSKPRAVGFAIRGAVRIVVMDGGLTLLAYLQLGPVPGNAALGLPLIGRFGISAVGPIIHYVDGDTTQDGLTGQLTGRLLAFPGYVQVKAKV